MPRRYRQKCNACAKVSPEDLPVPNGCVSLVSMRRLFTYELNKRVHFVQEVERFLPL